jgi:hypothetical protein
LQNRWHRFWAVCLFRCEGVSPEIPEIYPEIPEIYLEIPDFLETPEKSPEYPRFTHKFVLSGDFQDSPIHPPSRRHQDPFYWYQSLVLRFELNAWSLKMSTTCEVSFEPLRFDGSNYSSWSAHFLHVLHTWGSPFERVVEASILPEDFYMRTHPTYQRRKRKVCSITTLLLISCTIM